MVTKLRMAVQDWAWLAIAATIPGVSIWGRTLQRALEAYAGKAGLAIVLGIVLAGVALAAFYWVPVGRRRMFAVVAVAVLSAIHWVVPVAEERVHLLLFGGLAFFASQSIGYSLAAVACGVFAVGDEVLQWLLPDRVGAVEDSVMNLVGAGMGMAVARLRQCAG